MAKVYHAEIFGLREDKYHWLDKHNIKNVKWKKVAPHPEFYLFIPTDDKLANHYYSFYKMSDIFSISNTGVITKKDNFAIDFDKNALKRRTTSFIDKNLSDEVIAEMFSLSIKDKDRWNLKEARIDVRKIDDLNEFFTRIHYRPFDIRWIFYHDSIVARRVWDIMANLLEPNIALCIGRQGSVTGSDNYDIVFVSENIVDLNLFRRGGELVFPLYFYPDRKDKKKNPLIQMIMFEPEVKYQSRQPNIKPEIFEILNKQFSTSPSTLLLAKERGRGEVSVKPEEIFYYIYAVLYSNTYRTKYAEFLKIDFPRIPFTKDYKLFIKLGKLGKELADLHLLKSKDLDKTISKFPISGNNKVEKLKYEDDKVWINKEQYFTGVKSEVWEYQIGGYQVCEKWLKDRKKRTLNLDEIQTYCKIVTALSKTIELQKEIDKNYEGVEN